MSERKPEHKVILIVGLASERSCRLAVLLAEMGADIAVIYNSGAYDAARRVLDQVEALGRRCLIMASGRLASALVQQVIVTFGRLDVFISYPPPAKASTLPAAGELSVNGSEQPAHDLYRSLILPNFSLIKAVLNQMVE